MLSMLLGSSSLAFEIMLATFIAGLAFGGLWIKRRIDTLTDPVSFFGENAMDHGCARHRNRIFL